jgi:hypothetical protein
MSLDIHLMSKIEDEQLVFDTNITHNLGEMAGKAGIYYHLWRPEEIGVSKAGDLIKPLEQGLYLLTHQRDKFEKFNPENGWGNYDNLVLITREYINACIKYPNARIEVSR